MFNAWHDPHYWSKGNSFFWPNTLLNRTESVRRRYPMVHAAAYTPLTL